MSTKKFTAIDLRQNKDQDKTEEESKEDLKRKLRAALRSFYDLQKLRIEMGNRLIANMRSKLGLDDDDVEVTDDIMDVIEESFAMITDGVALLTARRKYDYDGVITDFTELIMVDNYLSLRDAEEQQLKGVKRLVRQFPIWADFLEDVKGVGETMGAVIIAEFDPHKGKYVSSFWRYAGLDVADDGKGRSKRKEHLIDVDYQASDGSTKTRKSITYNPFLKTKLMGVLATSFLRSGSEKYRKIYDDYKRRTAQRPKYADWRFAKKLESVDTYFPATLKDEDAKLYDTKKKGSGKSASLIIYEEVDGERGAVARYETGTTAAHRHQMSMRYMIKQFIADLYNVWREMEGLTVHDPYGTAKLGHNHEESGKERSEGGN